MWARSGYPLMTSSSSVSTGQVVIIVLIWVVIAVINIAYARRRPGRPERTTT